jgi:hypothetical protein
MSLHWTDISEDIVAAFRRGLVIPAHPLALDASRHLDERRQRALTRYYIDAGSGGIAVGVHTTQFAIREAGLYEQVLQLAVDEAENRGSANLFRIAGLAGPSDQAVAEAQTACGLGYHAGLLSLAALATASDDELIEHAERVAREIPLVGFYLQPAVGGRFLSKDFWRRFAALDNVIAVKIAPFNRYHTLDVVRGIAEAGMQDKVTLYTGNDDHIVLDLITPFTVNLDGSPHTLRIRGGLLGHWSVWTRQAVLLLQRIHEAIAEDDIDFDLLALDAQITDCNSAIFDVANNFQGVIAGCHEILRRQGLLDGIWCLDENEGLGSGQAAEIDRVTRAYPHLNDDQFVANNLERWLS